MKTGLMVAAACAAALGLAGAAQADTFKVTYEAPGVQESQAGFSFSGVERFDGRAVGNNQSFDTDFGTGDVITGHYSGVDVVGANQYGGAGGNTNFASTSTGAGYTLTLSTDDERGINYFGFWLSALDGGNSLSFWRGDENLFAFNTSDVLTLLGGNSDYWGNPNDADPRRNSGEPYVFLNFYDLNGNFDKVIFSETPQVGGYESDNHTVGFFTQQSGTPVPGVPEPASWALMIGGFAFAGAAMRRRSIVTGGAFFWNALLRG